MTGNEGNGAIQTLEKVFPGRVKHFMGNEEVDLDEAIHTMDVDYGYTRSEVTL